MRTYYTSIMRLLFSFILMSFGVLFTNGYVSGSVCSPSRAGLLTGRYQNRFGYTYNLIGYQNEIPDLGLPLNEVTFAEHLLEAGYVSAIIGKWHQGGTAKYHPYHQGFDYFYGFLHEGHYFVPPPYNGVTSMLRRKVMPGKGEGRWISGDKKLIFSTHMGYTEPGYNANNPILRGSQPVDVKEYLTDAFTREAIDFIDQNKDKPFLLYLPYNAVHSPLQGADKYMDKFAHIEDLHRRIFATMLSNLDESIGQVMDKLREEGMEENTIVFFLSDNGGPTKELTSSNAPLRGGKGTFYEGGIRVPFVMQWKGHLPENTIYNEPVISLDIFATISEAANHPTPKNIDGVNLLPYITGKNNNVPHDKLYWEMPHNSALRKGDWKIVRFRHEGSPLPWELYDLKNDLSESKNLAKKNSEKLKELINEWE